MMFALLAPILCLFVGTGIDYQRVHMRKTRLQEFADTLALRGAREFLLANAEPEKIKKLLVTIAAGDLSKQLGADSFEIDVAVDARAREVAIAITGAPEKGLFISYIPSLAGALDIRATATARGGSNVCLIALEASEASAIEATFSARLQAEGCALISNSTSSSGVRATGQSKLEASLICSAGGYYGSSAAFSPSPVSDCPVMEDPLAEREPPPPSVCDHYDMMLGDRNQDILQTALIASIGELAGESQPMEEIAREDYALTPGVYCGGLIVGSNARATFEPGVYVIKDGPFVVDMNGRIEGDGVGFYLVGDDATFSFGPDSKIELSAPTEGLLSGILFFEDRAAAPGRTHSILSNDARTLLGTFYLPKSTLFVSTISPVADKSAYTAIIARKVRMAGGPTLVLNSNYALTDVPVPDGVGPVGGEVFLRD